MGHSEFQNESQYYFIGGCRDGEVETIHEPAPEEVYVDVQGHLLNRDEGHSDWPFYAKVASHVHAGCKGCYVYIKRDDQMEKVSTMKEAA